MPQHNEESVILEGGTIVWEGVGTPKENENSGKLCWELGVVFPPNCPDLQPFDMLANKALQESEYRGTLPQGGHMPIKQVQQGKYDGLFDGWHIITFKTYLAPGPDIWNERGEQLKDVMQYRGMLYSGQRVNVLATCYSYNNKQKGIGGGLEAIRIIESANAPRINLGGSGAKQDSSSAFGGGQSQGGGYQQPAQQGQYQQSLENNQNQGYDNNGNAQNNGGGYQPNQGGNGGGGGYQPNQGGNGGGGGYQQTPQGGNGGGGGNNGGGGYDNGNNTQQNQNNGGGGYDNGNNNQQNQNPQQQHNYLPQR